MHKPDKQLWIVNSIDYEIPFTPKVDQFALDGVGPYYRRSYEYKVKYIKNGIHQICCR